MNLKEIIEARENVSKIIRKTPLIKTSISDKCNLYIKPENLQVTGSFKVRGAFNKLSKLTKEEKEKGVIACSAGNHAQGVALAAKLMNVKSVICMPKSAPKIKVNSTKELGAEVILVDGVYDDAYKEALKLQKEKAYTFIHPFNDEAVIAGQGTIALEILEELPNCDAIVCSVGGGGLISGIAYAAKQIKPNIKVYGVQTIGAPSMYASLVNGSVIELEHVHTFADGIAVKQVGDVTFDYVNKYVDDIVTVSEDKILDAIKLLMIKEKVIAEGAGAAPVGAVLDDIVPGLSKDLNVVCIVSGGNIDIDMLSKIILDGLEY